MLKRDLFLIFWKSVCRPLELIGINIETTNNIPSNLLASGPPTALHRVAQADITASRALPVATKRAAAEHTDDPEEIHGFGSLRAFHGGGLLLAFCC